MSLVLLFLMAAVVVFEWNKWQKSPQRERGWWSSKCVARQRLNIIVFCSIHDVWPFHPTSLHLGDASMSTMCELHEELSASACDDDEECWARIQSSLVDEELGRVGLSCHFAMDCLCAELYAL